MYRIRMATRFHTLLRRVLRSRIPAAVFLSAILVEAALLLRRPSALLIVTQLLILAAAVCWGYAARMRKEFPALGEFRRSEYSVVWDELSLSREDAAMAAAGEYEREALRSAGKEVATRIVRRADVSRAGDVLEIGSGVGRVGEAMALLSRSWTGCDISGNMLRHAADALAGLTNVHFVHLSGEGLKEIASNSFDLVYATNMLPHLSQLDRWIYVKEAHRVLRPGGVLYFDAIALDSPEGWAMMQNNLVQRQSGAEAPYTPVPSTAEEFLAYFDDADFSDTHVWHEGSLLIVTGKKAATASDESMYTAQTTDRRSLRAFE
jgi:SAM-dependent methyltransferase